MKYIGKPIKRKIDPRLIRGDGRYIADLNIPGTLCAAFLRSPHAHARILGIDLEQARKLPGVVAVFGPDDGTDFDSLPVLFPHPKLVPVTQRPLDSIVHHVGEPVAMVVALNRYIAEDAIELIKVDYEPLRAVAQLDDAIKFDAPLAHQHLESNVAAHFQQSVGDAKAAMKEAPVVVHHRFKIGRVSCLPIETRGLLAKWDYNGAEPALEVFAATQSQHEMRSILAKLLKVSETNVRVIAPDVGGAFGAKAIFYVEDFLVSWAARMVKAPVRWIEDRMEHMMSSIHEREQYHEASLGVTNDGKILSVMDKMLANNGAYVPWGIIVPIMTSTLIPGPYKVPNYFCDATVLYTNTVPLAPFRGAGRPQAALILNRLLDQAAEKLGIDPVEIRRRNLIQEDEFPYRTGLMSRDGKPQIYDSGNYAKVLSEAVEISKYTEWRKRQQEYRKQGRYIGIGVASAIENTGFGSFEGATVRIEITGDITVLTSAATQGQGHETTFAQVAAEVFDVPVEKVNVREGDTGLVTYGTGTFASRMGVLVGTAIYKASQAVKDKAKAIAAAKLNCALELLEMKDGYVFMVDEPSKRISLGELAHEARGLFPGTTFPYHITPGLEVTDYFAPEAASVTGMTDIAVVEIDPNSCAIKILDYTSVHDNGKLLNPLIVKGQVQGGISNGIGTALYEEIVYDRQGQLLTSTLMDYLVPSSCEIPDMKIGHVETPSPLNPLGMKGAGESGTIPVPAVIQSAVEDALREWNIKVENIPVKPAQLRELLRHKKQVTASGIR
ncbi:xanthine dehydrogenase family protein molybdopterin-binding subunit [Peribacillus saganii]|uniref:Xanthine dehydrogenase family protein molybdopterin-binding subunit n=1 Tax=Peribacillus saganii TaxID=2303992 RepID=A0A372LR51_9BACI|nr:xanthine dehydrogenase family protein molybdopterin-binding subunit [Peribacillus saganii]RFU70526.1 xanthine dehydrogenase family protein molybdopterin-binding subunit [Peribacillus saganii]